MSEHRKVRQPCLRGLAVALTLSLAMAAPPVIAGPAAPVFRPLSAAAEAPAESTPRFIIKMRPTATASVSTALTSSAVLEQALRQAGAGGGTHVAGSSLVLRRLAVGADLLQVPQPLSDTQRAAVLLQLRGNPAVAYAQVDTRKYPTMIPDDPHYPLQWHYADGPGGIRAPAAWDAANGTGVVVAVLDTGYVEHQDLVANLVPGYNFIHDPEVSRNGGRGPDARDMGDWLGNQPSSFHGTHVAGTIAAVTNNGLNAAGVAWGAKVQPVRVLGAGGGYTSDIVDAIVWASGGAVEGVPDNPTPAEVLNLSLGGSGSCADDPATQEAIDTALSHGSTVVVAAGNSNAPAGEFSPASCSGVITVGASGYTGGRASYSNYGPAVTLAAPGGDDVGTELANNYVWSLGNSGTREPDPSPEGDRTVGMQGTSMASPHVAAVVALMQDARVAGGWPALTPQQVRQLLRSTARPLPVPPSLSRSIGAGIVDAAAAVAAAVQDLPTEPSEQLYSRVPLTAQSAAAGEARVYRIEVPEGRSMLSLRTFGGAGQVAMYVARDRVPRATQHDLHSLKPGAAQTVQILNPVAGTWYVVLQADQGFEGVTVLGLY